MVTLPKTGDIFYQVWQFCMVYSYSLHTKDLVILKGSYIYSTTNTLDAVEAFIADNYVQLVITKANVLLHSGLTMAVQLQAV